MKLSMAVNEEGVTNYILETHGYSWDALKKWANDNWDNFPSEYIEHVFKRWAEERFLDIAWKHRPERSK